MCLTRNPDLVDVQTEVYRHGTETICLYRCWKCGRLTTKRLDGRWTREQVEGFWRT